MFRSYDATWLEEQFGQVESVALVGNGPSAGRSEFGRIIDACDLVVRMNGYAVQGFEKHTGERTDLFVSHLLHTYTAERLRSDGVRAVLVSRPAGPAFAHNAGLGVMLRNRPELGDLPTAWIPQQSFAQLYARLDIPADDASGRNPSSGLVAVQAMTSHQAVRRLVLVGFDCFPTHEPMHYFEDPVYDAAEVREVVAHSHRTDAERAALSSLLNEFAGDVDLPAELGRTIAPRGLRDVQ
ncbi:glycosyltransferase family 29 protein [Streptomyces sp. NBC_01537]|uniref:glycosyltransferase family 29 protein n=1 Tax=Streptomyces sp. NBC_01537 TaxID=2903896 RepID=UPI003864141F